MRPRPSLRNALAVAAVFIALWVIGTRSGPSHTPPLSSAPASSTQASVDLRRVTHPQVDPATLPADTVWTFADNGAESAYAVALDELYVPAGPAPTRLHTIAPQKDLPALVAAATALGTKTGTQPRLVLYPLDAPRDEHTRRIVTARIHIQTDNLDAVRAATSSLGLVNWQTPDYAPGHAIADVEGDPAQPLRAAALLARVAHVVSAAPLLAVQQSKRAVVTPDDPLFADQWHLDNTGQQDGTPGIDINVTSVWSTLLGTGINIGIVDDGLQLTHPDLAPNAAASGHYDWNGNDADPSPDTTYNYHGTAVAGLSSALGNNGIGVSGVAPESTLYGLRLIALPATDQDEAEAMNWKNDTIQIKNNSWGPVDYLPWILGSPGSLWKSAVANGTTSGRNGLGTLYVWAAGNGHDNADQGTKDAYATNINVIAVGASNNTGQSASFSEGGPHLVVSAPGQSDPGIVTTDLIGNKGYNPDDDQLSDQDYTQTFSGTSAASPIAAGVIALMLEANPDLGWRDVKEILLRSSTKLQPSSPDWVTRDGGQPDLPDLIKHHPFFGGGLINAEAAVALATTWTPLLPSTSVSKRSPSGTRAIPDAGAAIIVPINPDNGPTLRVEHVELTLGITHAYRGDLEITLTSPAGTVSTFATPTMADDGDNYNNWTFSSVRHWGESSEGTWQISIRDAFTGVSGTLGYAILKFHGVAPNAPVITGQPENTAAVLGSNVALSVVSADPGLTYQWARNGNPIFGATSATLNLNAITYAQVGTYTCTLTNPERVTITTTPARVAVYNNVAQPVAVNNGATFVTPAVVSGPFESLKWHLNDAPLPESGRVSGTTTATLTVRSLSSDDAGTYTLKSLLDGTTVTAGPIELSVRPPPDVTVTPAQSVRVGAKPVLSLASTGGPYYYAYTGLPKGVSYDPSTGVLTGRPSTAGTYTVFLAVTDQFGVSTTRTITLTVEPVPAALIGTFNGIVARDSSLNANLGGALNLVTTSSGSYTGKLTLGTGSYSFKGQLDGAAGGPATVTVDIPRKGQSSVQLQLTIPTDNTVATGTLDTVAVSAWRKTASANTYATKYIFALEPPDGEGDGSVWPAGYSTGSVTVTTAGAASWTLLPADGTAALKGTTTIAADGSLPLYAPVATPTGSFVGVLKLPPPSTPPDPITGSLSWLRRSTTSTLYANAAGFGPIDLKPYGGRFAAPASGTLLLGLPSGSNNAHLEFEDLNLGALSGALSPFTFTVAAGNKIVLPASNPTALKLTATASTGLFSGTFVLADPNPLNTSVIVKRTSKFSGVLLPTKDYGAGFFILPALPGTSTGTRSGAVFFTETE